MKALYIAMMALLLSAVSCTDSALDKEPLDLISDAVVWKDPVLINALMTQIYAETRVLHNDNPEHDNWAANTNFFGPCLVNLITDEATHTWITGLISKTALEIGGGRMEWWSKSYAMIRRLNDVIERLPSAPVDDVFKKGKIAEARFLRAFNYFAMVKRYGGVPIITRVQGTDEPEETLFPARDSEKAVYDFIISEMEAIAGDLPEANTAADYGHPSKYAALTLQCRAALYAGSIAQHGTVQLDGLLGFPASDAAVYYQKSYDAAKKIMTESPHSLYNADADKTVNFKNVFLKENGPEAIWVVKHEPNDYDQGGSGWAIDFVNCPPVNAWGTGDATYVYLEMMEEFEYADGRPGKLDYNAIQQGLWTMKELWGGRDPRFYATVFTQGTPWKGDTVQAYQGIILPDGTVQRDGSYGGILANAHTPNESHPGQLKYLDENKNNMGSHATSGTDWQIFRYAEVLLNYAEAAFELGKTADALDAINQIRDRAGIALLTTIDREAIRHERKVELAFEGHRYWDCRRWRTAAREFSVVRSGLNYILDYNSTTAGARKFHLQVYDADSRTNPPLFKEYNYYLPITNSRTANNPKLVENPGYF